MSFGRREQQPEPELPPMPPLPPLQLQPDGKPRDHQGRRLTEHQQRVFDAFVLKPGETVKPKQLYFAPGQLDTLLRTERYYEGERASQVIKTRETAVLDAIGETTDPLAKAALEGLALVPRKLRQDYMQNVLRQLVVQTLYNNATTTTIVGETYRSVSEETMESIEDGAAALGAPTAVIGFGSGETWVKPWVRNDNALRYAVAPRPLHEVKMGGMSGVILDDESYIH